MRGLDRLQQIRREGYRPSSLVMLATDPTLKAYEGWVVCDAGDSATLADLRVLVGLDVLVVGPGFDEVDAWAHAAVNAGARSVALGIEDLTNPAALEGPVWLKFNGEMLV